MSWDEVQTRLRQEVSKRLDVALCRIGLPPGRNGFHSQSVPGNFFFTPSELSGRVLLLGQLLPAQTAKIIADADEIRSHRFRLLGYRGLSYGPEIDWHFDAVHGLLSPLIPWFKINFLNFNDVGDHKVTWELNRHQHLVTLAKAWLLTRQKEYAEEIFAQWYSWQRANPYPLGANWASSLEVAFRSLSWIWVDHLLAGYSDSPPGFRNDLLHGLALNGRHIQRYLSTFFSPNTHLLGEAVVLFFLGTLYPQISSSSEWKKLGWQIVQQEAVRQVRPDGVYFEQTLHYHVYALDFLLYARLLALRNGMEVSSEFDQILRKMLHVLKTLSQAGPPDGFGDDDGGRLFDSSRNLAEHMTDPLAIGASLFQGGCLLPGTGVTEEALWLAGENAALGSGQTAPPGLKSEVFPDGGLYIATSSESFPQQMVIDAGPQGTGRCGHGHADALSMKLSFSGRRWLADAGTYCYIGPGQERKEFRGTSAHNTLSVDGLDQAQQEGPFAWSSIPETQVETYISRPTFTLFTASHSGYERLPQPVRHRRFIFQFGGCLYLIRDVATGDGTHLLETAWHLAPDLLISRCGHGFVAIPGEKEAHSVSLPRLTLLPVHDSRWKSEIASEHLSPVYGEKVSAQVLRCSARVPLPDETAMILVPEMDSKRPEISGTFVREELEHNISGKPDAVYRYEQGHIVYGIVFGNSQKSRWTWGPWTSDAQFLFFRSSDRRIDRLVLCHGAAVQFHGEPVISHGAPLQWLEWTRCDDREQLTCSNGAVGCSFSANVFAQKV